MCAESAVCVLNQQESKMGKKGRKGGKSKSKPGSSPKTSGRKSNLASNESELALSPEKQKGRLCHTSSLPVSAMASVV